MTFQQIGVRLALLTFLSAPAMYFGLEAIAGTERLSLAQEKLETIRTTTGNALRDTEMAKAQARRLATIGVKAWGQGPPEDRVRLAFLETDLTLDPTLQHQNPLSPTVQDQLVNSKRIVVRAAGTSRAAKEALWNLGDLGPGLRLETFKGELEPTSNKIIWTFVIQAIEPAPVAPQKVSSAEPGREVVP